MYHALLTNRYLTSRVIPLIAVAAVALCVALVIIVVSVMTGFLDMVKSSGRKLMGDVVVSYPVNGIPYYERLIDKIEQLPQAAAATPVVDSWGLLRMPYPDGPQKQTETVQLWGIEPASFAAVTGYGETLHWRELTDDQWKRLFADVIDKSWTDLRDMLDDDQKVALIKAALLIDAPDRPVDETVIRARLANTSDDQWRAIFDRLRAEPDAVQQALTEEQWHALLAHDARLLRNDQILQDGVTLSRNGRPAIALGMHVSEGNERQKDGSYEPLSMAGMRAYWWMLRFDVTLTTLPVTEGGFGSEPESVILPVANEFMSGVFLIDDKRIMIPLATAQELLHLDGGDEILADDNQTVLGIAPKRATMVLVRASDGVTPEELRDAVAEAYDEFLLDLAQDETIIDHPPTRRHGLHIKTWVEQQAQFIGPVEKERELMRTLFSIVYLVCAALVLSIFWAIVYEKTRDIGILRSIGASRGGIVWIFLRYGLIVGIIGAILGAGLAYLIVRNINHIHNALAEPPLALAVVVLVLALLALSLTIYTSLRGALLPMVLGSLITFALLVLGVGVLLLRQAGGFVMWDPSVYYFSVIPNTMDVSTAITTMIGAIVFSLLGAVIPAAKAADTDPVRALRYE